MSELPDKPSELIRLALSDLEKVMEDGRYVVNFNRFHSPRPDENQFNEDKKCHVCFAGAVMAKSLNSDIDEHLMPAGFDLGTTRKLFALDNFRVGAIYSGLNLMSIEMEMADVRIPQNNYHEFVSSMNDMANILEENGL